MWEDNATKQIKKNQRKWEEMKTDKAHSNIYMEIQRT